MTQRILTALNIADFIMGIIRTFTDINVVYSWGVRGYGAGYVADENSIQQPCLVLNVSGLVHTGFVAVYKVRRFKGRDGSDFVFSLALFDDDGKQKSEWYHDIMPNELGVKIDELVEKPKHLTNEEYQRLAEADSEYKMLADAYDAMAACM